MSRPSATEYSSFYQTYVNYTSGKDYSILVQQYHDRITESWAAIPAEKVNYAYAEDKWTIKQMLQHVIDTERIFAYRALSIARKEPAALLGFDENEYARHVNRMESGSSIHKLIVRFIYRGTNKSHGYGKWTTYFSKCFGIYHIWPCIAPFAYFKRTIRYLMR
jgi:hypothetical protein